MSNNVNTIMRGVLYGLFAHLTNNGSASNSASQTQPTQTTQTIPPTGDSAVRFDFSDPSASTIAGEQPVSTSTPAAQPQVVTPVPVAAAVPAQVTASASPRPMSEATAAGGAGTNAAAAEQTATTVIRDQPLVDDEARARAWALQSLARENMLGMVARMAERPDPAEVEPAEPAYDQQKAEPKTLALA